MKRFLIFFLLCQLYSRGYSQEASWKDRLYVEGNYHYGFMMPHSEYIAFFVREHIQGFQVNVGLWTDGGKSWHHSYNYPRFGIGYYRSGLSNRNIYGELNAVFAYVDRYYLNMQRKFNFGNRLSFGVGIINKRFDLENNSTNLAIGSNLNAYINYSLETSYRIFSNTSMKLGAGITHVSNGNYRQPNKGLNFFTGFTGITYTFQNQAVRSSFIPEEDNSRHRFLLLASYGMKQISRKLDMSFPVYGISGEYTRLITGNSWGGAALTCYYDPSLEKELSLNDTVQTSSADRVRVTLNLAYELKMGRISYVFQPGIYLKNPFKQPGIISNKLSVRYQINSRLVAGVTVKAHWFAIADLFEWSIGYNWKK